QSLHIRFPSRLTVAERLRPLPEPAEKRVEESASAAPGTENVILRMTLDHTAGILDDIPAAGAALDGDAAHTRIHSDIDAGEIVEGATYVVRERQEVVGQPELCGFDVVERQRISAAARQPAVLRQLIRERIEVGRCPRAVDLSRQISPLPVDIVQLDRGS